MVQSGLISRCDKSGGDKADALAKHAASLAQAPPRFRSKIRQASAMVTNVEADPAAVITTDHRPLLLQYRVKLMAATPRQPLRNVRADVLPFISVLPTARASTRTAPRRPWKRRLRVIRKSDSFTASISRVPEWSSWPPSSGGALAVPAGCAAAPGGQMHWMKKLPSPRSATRCQASPRAARQRPP